ncbi:MAG: hypothetical protein R2749_18665 [Acidimicrobiales bacterium]
MTRADELLHRTSGGTRPPPHPRRSTKKKKRKRRRRGREEVEEGRREAEARLAWFLLLHHHNRDGKYQLASLAGSGFDPLARTCQFMLKESPPVRGRHREWAGHPAHDRADAPTARRRRPLHSGVNLDTLQRYLNFHFSVSLDLFGSETSVPRQPARPGSRAASRRRPAPTTTACTATPSRCPP